MNNLILSAGIWSAVGDWIKNLLISLGLLIDNIIYVFINWMYRIFILIAKIDIFKDGTEIEAIASRLYVIVGIGMLFIFAYNLTLLIIDPEGKQLGNMAKVVKNAIISIILVTLLPLIFTFLTTLQNHIIESNVIAHIILGTSTKEEIDQTNKKAGVETALNIFSAFYHPEGQTIQSCRNTTSAHPLCSTYVNAFDQAVNDDDITSFIWNSELKDGVLDGSMEYTWIVSTIAGAIALWLFVSFALDIGVRVGKLAFYEVISPIPIMMRILPGDKMFDKWFKGIKDTYISLFIRLAIIYFCMYAVTLVPTILTNMWAGGDAWPLLAIANVVVILGILQFAKDAPKLIGDLFSNGGEGVKFGIKDKLTGNTYGMGAMGLVGGGATALASNVSRMFKREPDEETGKNKLKFNYSNPLRGVVRGAVKSANQGRKATTFEQLGAAITEGRNKTVEINQKHKSRHSKGEEWIKDEENLGHRIGDKIRGDGSNPIRKTAANIIDNTVEGVIGGGIEIKDAVIQAGKTTLDYLNAGAEVSSESSKKVVKSLSAIEDALKTFNGGITPIENTAKSWKEDFDKNQKVSREINNELLEVLQKRGVDTEAIINPIMGDVSLTESQKQEKVWNEIVSNSNRSDVTTAIDSWEKRMKTDKIADNFEKNQRTLGVFKEQIIGSLKDLMPTMSVELENSINKACGTTNIQASLEKLNSSSNKDLANQLGAIKKALNNEKTYIDLVARKKAEDSKK